MVVFNKHYRPLIQIALALSAGLLLGIASSMLSPLWVLAGLVILGFAIIVLKRPEIGLLGILVATSSIVFEDQLPLLSIGGVSLHISDLVLLSLLVLIALRWLVEPEFKIVRTPLDLPLLIFYFVTLLSTFIAINHSSVNVIEARRDFRIMTYYLTFFIVTNLVRERRQINLLLTGILFLATIVATAMVLQFLLGDRVHLLPGRVETLNTQGTVYEDITRILPPGWSIILVSFVVVICTLILEKSKLLKWLKLFQLGLLGMALLFTFLRSYWASLIIVLFLLIYLLKGYERKRLIGWGLVVIISAAIILLVVFSDPGTRAARLVGAAVNRFTTITNSGTFQGQDSSLNWRMIENEYALSAIASNPLIGLGMSARYRPWDPRIDLPLGAPDANFDFRNFIHNGHLLILLQSGLLGYLSLMWLSLAFLMRGLRYWRSITDDRLRGAMLGFTLVYLTVLIAAVVNSTFMQWRWTPIFGIIMGINEIILRKDSQEVSVS